MNRQAETWICKYHGREVVSGEGSHCPQCMIERHDLPNPEFMTAEQRAAEFEFWINRHQLTVEWSVFKIRLEALLGRGIWTHELSTANCPGLVQEAWGQIPRPQVGGDKLGICLHKRQAI